MRCSNCFSEEAIDSSLLFIKAEKHSRSACISSSGEVASALASRSHAVFPTTAANSSISERPLEAMKGSEDNRTRGPHSQESNQFVVLTLEEEFYICYRPEATQGLKGTKPGSNHLWLVVGILVQVRAGGVQLLCMFLITQKCYKRK